MGVAFVIVLMTVLNLRLNFEIKNYVDKFCMLSKLIYLLLMKVPYVNGNPIPVHQYDSFLFDPVEHQRANIACRRRISNCLLR